MRRFRFFMLVMLVSPTTVGAEDELSGQELSKIDAVLASLNCRANTEMIEKQGNQYVIRDVFCADGQYSIQLNALFEVVVKRTE